MVVVVVVVVVAADVVAVVVAVVAVVACIFFFGSIPTGFVSSNYVAAEAMVPPVRFRFGLFCVAVVGFCCRCSLLLLLLFFCNFRFLSCFFFLIGRL